MAVGILAHFGSMMGLVDPNAANAAMSHAAFRAANRYLDKIRKGVEYGK
jgi:hypothetical protein